MLEKNYYELLNLVEQAYEYGGGKPPIDWELLDSAYPMDNKGVGVATYINHRKKSIVVAIRGTDNQYDFVNDLRLAFAGVPNGVVTAGKRIEVAKENSFHISALIYEATFTNDLKIRLIKGPPTNELKNKLLKNEIFLINENNNYKIAYADRDNIYRTILVDEKLNEEFIAAIRDEYFDGNLYKEHKLVIIFSESEIHEQRVLNENTVFLVKKSNNECLVVFKNKYNEIEKVIIDNVSLLKDIQNINFNNHDMEHLNTIFNKLSEVILYSNGYRLYGKAYIQDKINNLMGIDKSKTLLLSSFSFFFKLYGRLKLEVIKPYLSGDSVEIYRQLSIIIERLFGINSDLIFPIVDLKIGIEKIIKNNTYHLKKEEYTNRWELEFYENPTSSGKKLSIDEIPDLVNYLASIDEPISIDVNHVLSDIIFPYHITVYDSNSIFKLEIPQENYATIKEEFLQINKIFSNYKITVTGHSLGAAIAEIIASTQKLPAVLFESPGAKVLLREQHGYDEEFVKNNFIYFLAAPDLVNTLYEHVGKGYRLYIPHAEKITWDFFAESSLNTAKKVGTALSFFIPQLVPYTILTFITEESLALFYKDIKFLYNQHSLTNMKTACFDPESGEIYKDKIALIKTWPYRGVFGILTNKGKNILMKLVPFKSDQANLWTMFTSDENTVIEKQISNIAGYEVSKNENDLRFIKEEKCTNINPEVKCTTDNTPPVYSNGVCASNSFFPLDLIIHDRNKYMAAARETISYQFFHLAVLSVKQLKKNAVDFINVLDLSYLWKINLQKDNLRQNIYFQEIYEENNVSEVNTVFIENKTSQQMPQSQKQVLSLAMSGEHISIKENIQKFTYVFTLTSENDNQSLCVQGNCRPKTLCEINITMISLPNEQAAYSPVVEGIYHLATVGNEITATENCQPQHFELALNHTLTQLPNYELQQWQKTALNTLQENSKTVGQGALMTACSLFAEDITLAYGYSPETANWFGNGIRYSIQWAQIVYDVANEVDAITAILPMLVSATVYDTLTYTGKVSNATATTASAIAYYSARAYTGGVWHTACSFFASTAGSVAGSLIERKTADKYLIPQLKQHFEKRLQNFSEKADNFYTILNNLEDSQDFKANKLREKFYILIEPFYKKTADDINPNFIAYRQLCHAEKIMDETYQKTVSSKQYKSM